MYDCSGISSLFGTPGLLSHWKRENVAHWIDKMRAEGYDKAPKLKVELDDMEREYQSKPISLGTALENAVEAKDSTAADSVLKEIAAQALTSREESLCTAKKLNDDRRYSDPSLPELTLVQENGTTPGVTIEIATIQHNMMSVPVGAESSEKR